MLVDTHCHLGDAAFRADAEQVVMRARAAGVAHIVTVGESREAAGQALSLARRFPGVSATAGVHPHEASSWNPDTAVWLEGALAEPEVVAAGEMGLDYHYDHAPRAVQRRVFDEQLGLAHRLGKPAVIHAREADADLAAILNNHPSARVVLHSFSSGPVLLEAGLVLDCYVSFSGMITFRNWTADPLIRQVPRNRLLVETDAPYLAPTPYRGTRNEPAYVARVAERLAEVIGLPVPETIALTGANAATFFGARLTPDQELP